MFNQREKLVIFACLQFIPPVRLMTICTDFMIPVGQDTPIDEMRTAIRDYFNDLYLAIVAPQPVPKSKPVTVHPTPEMLSVRAVKGTWAEKIPESRGLVLRRRTK